MLDGNKVCVYICIALKELHTHAEHTLLVRLSVSENWHPQYVWLDGDICVI